MCNVLQFYNCITNVKNTLNFTIYFYQRLFTYKIELLLIYGIFKLLCITLLNRNNIFLKILCKVKIKIVFFIFYTNIIRIINMYVVVSFKTRFIKNKNKIEISASIYSIGEPDSKNLYNLQLDCINCIFLPL